MDRADMAGSRCRLAAVHHRLPAWQNRFRPGGFGGTPRAGWDVFGVEPSHDSPLLQLLNAMVSTHIAGLGGKSMRLMLDQCADNAPESTKTPVTLGGEQWANRD